MEERRILKVSQLLLLIIAGSFSFASLVPHRQGRQTTELGSRLENLSSNSRSLPIKNSTR